MRDQVRMQLSRRELEAKNQLLTHRGELTASVFQQAEEQIRAFTQSPAYGDFLAQAAGRLSKVLTAGDTILRLREEDLQRHGQAVQNAFGSPVKLEGSEHIRLGGLLGESGALGLIADETLDARLEEQRGWFMEHSGLIVY